MFFKLIDKLLSNLKKVISAVSFFLIGFAIYFFVYWLLYSANVPLPQAFTGFSWAIIDFFAFAIKHKPIYSELLPVLPVATCAIFIFITYFLNCLINLVDVNQTLVKDISVKKRIALEKKINTQLHKSFIDELNINKFAMIKIKIVATQQESYLSSLNTDPIDLIALAKKIETSVLDSFDSQLILKKGRDDNSLFFILNDLSNMKNIVTQLVSISTQCINKELRPKLSIDFLCGIDLAGDNLQFPGVASYLDRIINLKIKNKILVSPKFKVYFENIFPDVFSFNMSGEYNLSEDPLLVKEVTLYYITRKS